MQVIFYLNSVMDWYQYELHQYCVEHPSMWLHDSKGKVVSIAKQGVFDLRSEDVRKMWVDVLTNAAASGVIDGAFMDRGGAPTSFPGI